MSLSEICAILREKIDQQACCARLYIEDPDPLVKDERNGINKRLLKAIKAFRKSPDFEEAGLYVEGQLDYLFEVVRKLKPKKEKDNCEEMMACLKSLEYSEEMTAYWKSLEFAAFMRSQGR